MKKIIISIIIIIIHNVCLASWWSLDSTVWNKINSPHKLHLVSQIPHTGIQIKSITQFISNTNDSLFVSCLFTNCSGFQSFYTWDSTIELLQMNNMNNYNLVLYIGYDTNSNPNCNIYNSLVLDTVYLGSSTPTNINYLNKEFYKTLSPNPVQNILTLQSQEPMEQVSIYNMYGVLVQKQTYSEHINVAALRSGVYVLEARGKQGVWRSKFQKE